MITYDCMTVHYYICINYEQTLKLLTTNTDHEIYMLLHSL